MLTVDVSTGELVHELDDYAPQWVEPGDSLTTSSYPDYEASELRDLSNTLKNLAAPGHCGRYSAMGRCADGSEYRKVLICRRDWCRTCGENWSDAHRRRFAGWLPKVSQIQRMGYMVVTLPEEARPRTQLEWALMGAYTVDVLQDFGISRGLRRWHWFGELWVAYWQQIEPDLKLEAAEAKYRHKTPEDARRDGIAPKWHPHLNIIIDGDDIPTEKSAFTAWSSNIREQLSEVLGCRVNVHYEYADDPAQKVHITKYVLRGTFLDSNWDPDMAQDLAGFNNSAQWGRRGDWLQEPSWTMEPDGVGAEPAEEPLRPELIELHNGECPCCHQSVQWGGIERTVFYRDRIEDDYGGGYYRVRLDVFELWDSQPLVDVDVGDDVCTHA